MSKSVSNALILACATLGCIVTIVLMYEHFHPGADIGCSAVGGSCAAAQDSDYGHVGRIPTSAFGLAMYISLVGLCISRGKRLSAAATSVSDAASVSADAHVDDDLDDDAIAAPAAAGPASSAGNPVRLLDLTVLGIATLAVGISWWLQYIALYKLGSFCPWCMSSAALVTVIFLTASNDALLRDIKLVGEQRLLAGTVTLLAVMGLFMVTPDVLGHIAKIRFAAGQAVPGPRPDITPAEAIKIATADMEVTGPSTAPFTLVEFADYQCPHCMKTSVMLTEELKKYPTKYRLAFRNYPLDIHKWAVSAALAAEAAGEQGKFWQMHDYIFAHQADMDNKDFNQARFMEYAAKLGLDTSKFEKDVQSDKITNRVAVDRAVAPRLEIKMTPTFFVLNGKGKVFQITGFEAVKQALEDPGNKAWQ